ncbi:MAG: T9SS type A sorting domain-containing protein [Ignavibacteriae bacterium]|nr:T9SS type A sorting domain-containing protein [Ignavibacteriota bacterium]
MRFFTILFSVLVISSFLFAQRKVVITSNGDMIPLKRGQSAFEAVKQSGLLTQDADVVCTDKTAFGYKSTEYPCNNPFIGYHKDVWAQWFVSPSEGLIDTLFWQQNDQNELADSSVKVRIFVSNIYPPGLPSSVFYSGTSGSGTVTLDPNGRGPGWGPYHPPRSCWGYYNHTGDLDQGISPFKDLASDTDWVPTNMLAACPGTPDAVPSFDPLGVELWGLGGFPKKIQAGPDNPINKVAMSDLGVRPEVTTGLPIFVTLEDLGEHDGDDNSHPATWCMTGTGLPTPTRNWKFYEHVTAGSQGWHARSDATWIWWMVMTVTGDVAPDFLSYNQLSHTLSTGPRTVTAHIQDCYPGDPDSAGIASVTFSYSINGGSYTTVAMTNTSGDEYQATIPGVEAGGYVRYRLNATDIRANGNESATIQYQVIGLRNAYYVVDSAASVPWPDIATNGGTRVGNTEWFNFRSPPSDPNDDGTAGPIDMGHNFTFFGDPTLRYAWIGVNGAIALSSSPSDTQNINGSGGTFTSNWIFPGTISQSPIYDEQPENIISFMYNDWVAPPVAPDLPEAHGSIYYKTDGSKFIVEFDSVGNLNNIADSTTQFAVILDSADNSISFVYKEVGIGGYDTAALIGLQADSNRWFMFYKTRAPIELTPRNGRAFKFEVIAANVAAADGWNMLSVPGSPTSYTKSYLFPAATSPAFAYEGAYTPKDPLANGPGYWLKFSGAQEVHVPGTEINSLAIDLLDKWNMVGSISTAVPVDSVTFTDATMVSANFFGYAGGYFPATTIEPAQAYWVKVSATGGNPQMHLNAPPAATPKVVAAGLPAERFILQAGSELEKMNKLMITDKAGYTQTLYVGDESMTRHPASAYELPPPAPEGMDARFASQQMVEIHPSKLEGELSYRVLIRNAAYPLTLNWEMKKEGSVQYQLTYLSGGKEVASKIMNGKGSVRIPQADELMIKVRSADAGLPKSFSLGQNYPNPFNPSTVIDYALPEDAYVSLKIFNIAGQEIVSLVDGIQTAGYHSVSWSSRNLSQAQTGTGVYFYQLIATSTSNPKVSFNEVRKMVLVK